MEKIDEREYIETLINVKVEINKAIESGRLLSFSELGKILGKDPEFIKDVVGRRFSELTKKVMYSPFSPPDPDFYLLGDGIHEIANNKMYKSFKKRLTAKEKGTGIIGRIMRAGM